MSAAAAGRTLGWSGTLFFGGLTASTALLGVWQSKRYFEKIDMMAVRDYELNLPIVSLMSNNTSTPNSDAKPFQRRYVEGTFRHEEEILVGPRGPPTGALAATGVASGRNEGGMNSSPQGYHVMTPLEVKDGTNSKTIIVNRGWIPRHFIHPLRGNRGPPRTTQQQQQPVVDRPSGIQKVVGILSKGENPRFMKPKHDYDKFPLTMFWMDIVTLNRLAGIPKEEEPHYLIQTTAEASSTKSFPARPPVTLMGEYKTTPMIHAGYAVSWFGMAAAGIIMTRKLITKGR